MRVPMRGERQQQQQQQPFNGLCSGTRPVPEETLTHSPILIIGQPLTPFSIYNDP